MRSRKEMMERLRRKEFANIIISDVIKDLETQGLINDRKFAQAFASDRMHLSHKGKRLIFAELIKKGIDGAEIKSVLNGIDETSEQDACKELINKYRNRYQRFSSQEKKQKLYALLSRRGFSYSIIKDVLNVTENES
jgi:regulatory protein